MRNINYFNKTKDKRDDLQHLKANLGEANGNLAKARKLLLAETIDATDFKAMKAGYEKEILRLEVKINALSQEFNSAEIKQLVEKATTAIYPQNLEYDGHQFRTTHLNEVIATTFSLDAAFQKEKSRQNGAFSILSAKEVSSRFPILITIICISINWE